MTLTPPSPSPAFSAPTFPIDSGVFSLNTSIAFASTEFQIAILCSLGARNTRHYSSWTKPMKPSVLMEQKKVIVFQPWQNVLKSIDSISLDVRRVNCSLREIERTHSIRVVFALNRRVPSSDTKRKRSETETNWKSGINNNVIMDSPHDRQSPYRCSPSAPRMQPYAKWVLCGLHAMHDAMCSRAQVNGQCEHCMRTANEWHVNSFHLNCSLDHLIRSL